MKNITAGEMAVELVRRFNTRLVAEAKEYQKTHGFSRESVHGLREHLRSRADAMARSVDSVPDIEDYITAIVEASAATAYSDILLAFLACLRRADERNTVEDLIHAAARRHAERVSE